VTRQEEAGFVSNLIKNKTQTTNFFKAKMRIMKQKTSNETTERTLQWGFFFFFFGVGASFKSITTDFKTSPTRSPKGLRNSINKFVIKQSNEYNLKRDPNKIKFGKGLNYSNVWVG
jgi:hypothetical protein